MDQSGFRLAQGTYRKLRHYQTLKPYGHQVCVMVRLHVRWQVQVDVIIWPRGTHGRRASTLILIAIHGIGTYEKSCIGRQIREHGVDVENIDYIVDHLRTYNCHSVLPMRQHVYR